MVPYPTISRRPLRYERCAECWQLLRTRGWSHYVRHFALRLCLQKARSPSSPIQVLRLQSELVEIFSSLSFCRVTMSFLVDHMFVESTNSS